MNELTIDGKIYISSKRAAEVTGYAKDYVGQLCREGRVTARLVGRAWYVLETSIMEHRFASDEAKAPAKHSVMRMTDTWEAPKYAVEAPESLPEVPKKPVEEAPQGSVAAMQAAWQEWFSMKKAPELEPEHLLMDHEVNRDGGSIEIKTHSTRTEVETPVPHAEEIIEAPEAVYEEPEVVVNDEPYEVNELIASEQAEAEAEEPVQIHIDRIITEPKQPVHIQRFDVQPTTRRETLAEELAHNQPLFIEIEEDIRSMGPGGFAVRAVLVIVALIAVGVGMLGSGVLNGYISNKTIMGYTSYITGTTEVAK